MTATTAPNAPSAAICRPAAPLGRTRRNVGVDPRPVLRRLSVLWMSVNDSPAQVALDGLGVPGVRR